VTITLRKRVEPSIAQGKSSVVPRRKKQVGLYSLHPEIMGVELKFVHKRVYFSFCNALQNLSTKEW
jgi:hypothetical protein